jgi:hypothetical protein
MTAGHLHAVGEYGLLANPGACLPDNIMVTVFGFGLQATIADVLFVVRGCW